MSNLLLDVLNTVVNNVNAKFSILLKACTRLATEDVLFLKRVPTARQYLDCI
jgi:hypothetical protein